MWKWKIGKIKGDLQENNQKFTYCTDSVLTQTVPAPYIYTCKHLSQVKKEISLLWLFFILKMNNAFNNNNNQSANSNDDGNGVIVVVWWLRIFL